MDADPTTENNKDGNHMNGVWSDLDLKNSIIIKKVGGKGVEGQSKTYSESLLI